eukprot:GHVN01003517.1.p1 GENE.GHVN01003517.1~~GHVN01003517.1.p1  ORF type:complete len:390 (+),score=73.51 GHVN01003517.1:1681-2850(+)
MYKTNAYHNHAHASFVGHTVFTILDLLGLKLRLTELEIRTITVAALCHDVAHPGRNNAFHVNSFDTLATVYNDQSVLEKLHTFTTLCILQQPQANVFADCPDLTDWSLTRRRLIEMILTTDMKHHFTHIGNFRGMTASQEFDIIDNQEDRWATIEMCLKAADIGHAGVEWRQHHRWSSMIVHEFYSQGDEEARMGVVVSPLCDKSKHAEIAKSQAGFIEFVVMPLFNELQVIDLTGQLEEVADQLSVNQKEWEAIAQKQQHAREEGILSDSEIEKLGIDLDTDMLSRPLTGSASGFIRFANLLSAAQLSESSPSHKVIERVGAMMRQVDECLGTLPVMSEDTEKDETWSQTLLTEFADAQQRPLTRRRGMVLVDEVTKAMGRLKLQISR